MILVDRYLYLIIPFSIITCSHVMSLESGISRLPSCRKFSGIFSDITENSRLTNVLSLTISNTLRNPCIYHCIQNLKCKSVSHSEKQQICLLHYDKKNENGATLEAVAGWIFYQSADKDYKTSGPVCTKEQPCKHGKCVDDCDGYQCTCDPCYFGKNCDQYIYDDNNSAWGSWNDCSVTCNAKQRTKEILNNQAIEAAEICDIPAPKEGSCDHFVCINDTTCYWVPGKLKSAETLPKKNFNTRDECFWHCRTTRPTDCNGISIECHVNKPDLESCEQSSSHFHCHCEIGATLSEPTAGWYHCQF